MHNLVAFYLNEDRDRLFRAVMSPLATLHTLRIAASQSWKDMTERCNDYSRRPAISVCGQG